MYTHWPLPGLSSEQVTAHSSTAGRDVESDLNVKTNFPLDELYTFRGFLFPQNLKPSIYTTYIILSSHTVTLIYNNRLNNSNFKSLHIYN